MNLCSFDLCVETLSQTIAYPCGQTFVTQELPLGNLYEKISCIW